MNTFYIITKFSGGLSGGLVGYVENHLFLRHLIRLIFITVFAFFIFLPFDEAKAANCGGATPCACGDTVIASTILTGNLTCTGHGLIVGANGVTIDGNNYTITGDGELGDYGINNLSGYDNLVIQNFANITQFEHGIFLFDSSSNVLTNNTANSNTKIGILLYNSNSNTLTNNSMSSNNVDNLSIIGSTDTHYNNTIDTSNTVEGKPVYYFYGQSNQTYDGDAVGSIGMFWCISCTNITVKNATLSANNLYGIYFRNTSSSTIQNTIVNSNFSYGIYIHNSSLNTIDSNTISSNRYGIYFSNSSSSALTNNTISLNNYGIYFSNSSSNTLTNNTISKNNNDIYDNGTNTYSNNKLLHNIASRMLAFTETARTKNLNDTVNFTLAAEKADGTACANCTTITTSPSEISLNYSDDGNGTTTGSFQVTKLGTYSLNILVTDSNNNITKRNYLFFVNASSSTTSRHYLRGINPTHGQPKGSDSKSLSLTAPTSTETWFCGIWVQNSPDEIPNYPLSHLAGANTYSWYKQSAASGAYIGIQRFVAYNTSVDFSEAVAAAANYTWVNKNLTGLTWGMDYPENWYWLSLKLNGTNPYWQTTQAQPSYVDFSYSYTATPTIKSNSNANIIILSATASSTATSSANIILDNPNSQDDSTTITLENFRRPFLNATSTIYSNTLVSIAFPVSGNTTSSFDAVAMDISPSSGSVQINIDTWNTSGNYYKKWTESSTSSDIISAHTVGDFSAGEYYRLKVDDIVLGTIQANATGSIEFTYSGGYSEKTFELEEAVIATPTALSPTVLSSSAIRWNFLDNDAYETGFRLYDVNGNIKGIIGANAIYIDETGLEAGTSYTRYVKAYNAYGESDASATATGQTSISGGVPAFSLPPSPPGATASNPQGGFRIEINNGATSTDTRNVQLKFFATSAIKFMAISESPAFSGAPIQQFQESFDWTLSPGDGRKVVYAFLYNQNKISTNLLYDSIILEAPSNIAGDGTESGISATSTNVVTTSEQTLSKEEIIKNLQEQIIEIQKKLIILIQQLIQLLRVELF